MTVIHQPSFDSSADPDSLAGNQMLLEVLFEFVEKALRCFSFAKHLYLL